MKYISTRNKEEGVSFCEAVLKGISSEGGLYVPESFPNLTMSEIFSLVGMEYYERAAFILSRFMTDFSIQEIMTISKKSYDKFEKNVAPLKKLDDKTFVLELFHGPTMAFKDFALTFLPYAMTYAAKKHHFTKDLAILVATSGDTGKAALESFKDVPGTRVMVFYPQEGVSEIQKLQMTSQEGSNVMVVGVDGNFDNCQKGVKRIFANKTLESTLRARRFMLSSANSINLGRLLPQICYYFSAYADLVTQKAIVLGDKVDFSVPTGNFGDILAGYYAKKMGLPVGKLICASNQNNVLTDFIDTGKYNIIRDFHKTSSPSMDILVSSNLERYLFDIDDFDCHDVYKKMEHLRTRRRYRVSAEESARLQEDFYGEFCTEEENQKTIKETYEKFSYAIDPHTACGVYGINSYRKDSGSESVAVALSTASPYKFLDACMTALGMDISSDPFENAQGFFEKTGMEIPKPFEELRGKTPRFFESVIPRDMAKSLLKYLIPDKGTIKRPNLGGKK